MAVKYIDFTNDQMRQMLALQPRNMATQVQAQPTTTTQTQPRGTLESILGGIGDSIANVGKSAVGLIGSGAAGIADLATGKVAKSITTDELRKLYNETGAKGYLDLIRKAANDGKVHYTGDLGFDPNTGEVRGYELANEGKNQDAFKKWLYGEDKSGNNPNYAKAAGEALDAAATVSNFIPGANGGASMAKALGFNALQGAASGFGQTYADTGGDLESALKGAVAGGAAGAATGGLNRGLNNAISKGGKLANFAASKPLASTLTRGALSGAVGGGVGGGTMAALNGEDITSAAVQGAGGGAMGGALAAPMMYAANKAASAVPGIKGIQGGLNELEQDYQTAKQNGQRYYGFGSDNKAETAPGSLRDTSVAGDMINGAGKAVGAIKNVADDIYTKSVNKNAINRLANAIESGADGNVRFARISQELLDDINLTREAQGYAPLTKRQVKAYENTINNHLRNRVEEGMTPRQTAEVAFNALTNEDAVSGAINPEKGLGNPVFAQDELGRYNQAIVGRAEDGGTSLKTSIPNATDSQIKRILQNREDVLSSLEGVASPSSLSENPNARATISSRQANQSIAQDDANVNNDLMYGESELANRTSKQNRGNMIKRLGEVMEGAQSNTTRVQNRKLGLKSAGNAVDKVYKKTGISDLDVQTELAKELTGGANSYLDEIQRTALSATEDGSQRTVDTSPVVAKIETLVDDKISETNLSGNKRQQFIGSLKRDVQKGDTITASNRLKEQAQVLFDKKENMTPLDKQQAKVYQSLAQDLDDLSYSAVPKDNVDAMFETAITESRGRAAQAKEIGNKQIATAYEKIADNLEKLPRTIQAFRSFKKDFVDVSKMGELSALGEQAVLAQNGANLTGNIKRFVNKALQKPTNQALAFAGSKISDLGEKIASPNPTTPSIQATNTPAVAPVPVDRIGNFIGRAGGAGLASDMAAGGTPSTLEQQLASMNTKDATNAAQSGMAGNYYSGADVYGNATTPTANTGMGSMYGSPYGQNDDYLSRIEVGIQNAFNAGDFQSVEYLMNIYNSVAKLYAQNEPKQTKLTATQQRANAAASSLQRLSSMTPDTGYTVSGIPIIGNIATATGNSYLSEAQSLAQQIGYMVSGANIKKEEAESIGRAYVPQPFDSEQIRNEKLQRAAEIIAMYQNGYVEE